MHGAIQSAEPSCILRGRTLICCLSVFKSPKKLPANNELYAEEWKGTNPFYNKISCIVMP